MDLAITGWSMLIHRLGGKEGHLDHWNVVHKQKSLCCAWKLIKGFQVPLSSLEIQPHLLGVWALMTGLAGYSLVTSSSPPVLLLTWDLLRAYQLYIISVLISSPSVTGDNFPQYMVCYLQSFFRS